MKKIRVLIDSEINLTSNLADTICISENLSKDIQSLSNCTIAVFTESTDSILVGYALSTGIKVFILGTGLSDIKDAFPDICTNHFYDKLIKDLNAEIQIQYDYETSGA